MFMWVYVGVHFVHACAYSLCYLGCCHPQREVGDGGHGGVQGRVERTGDPSLALPCRDRAEGGWDAAHALDSRFGVWAQHSFPEGRGLEGLRGRWRQGFR